MAGGHIPVDDGSATKAIRADTNRPSLVNTSKAGISGPSHALIPQTKSIKTSPKPHVKPRPKPSTTTTASTIQPIDKPDIKSESTQIAFKQFMDLTGREQDDPEVHEALLGLLDIKKLKKLSASEQRDLLLESWFQVKKDDPEVREAVVKLADPKKIGGIQDRWFLINFVSFAATEKNDKKAREAIFKLTGYKKMLGEDAENALVMALEDMCSHGDKKAMDVFLKLNPIHSKAQIQFNRSLISLSSRTERSMTSSTDTKLVDALCNLVTPDGLKNLPDELQDKAIDALCYNVFNQQARNHFIRLLDNKKLGELPENVRNKIFKNLQHIEDGQIECRSRYHYNSGDIANIVVLALRGAHTKRGVSGTALTDMITELTQDNPLLLYTAFCSEENFDELAHNIIPELKKQAKANGKELYEFIEVLDPSNEYLAPFLLQTANFNKLNDVLTTKNITSLAMDHLFNHPDDLLKRDASLITLFTQKTIEDKEFKHNEYFQEHLIELYRNAPPKSLKRYFIASILGLLKDKLSSNVRDTETDKTLQELTEDFIQENNVPLAEKSVETWIVRDDLRSVTKREDLPYRRLVFPGDPATVINDMLRSFEK